MYDFYNNPIPKDRLKKSRKELKRLYEQIPSTTGCAENTAKPEGCDAWCCRTQSPQVMFSEFLNTWNHVTSTKTPEDIAKLVIKAMRSYMFPDDNKGCLFFDEEHKTCSQHTTRPYNCRTYGQVPNEEFKPRLERLKVLYPDATFRDQCNLVMTEGKRPTTEDMDVWFHHLRMIERDVLGDNNRIARTKDGKYIDLLIHDGDGGTYRRYVDHILLLVGDFVFLDQMTKVRTTGTVEEKEKFIKQIEPKLMKNVEIMKVQ